MYKVWLRYEIEYAADKLQVTKVHFFHLNDASSLHHDRYFNVIGPGVGKTKEEAEANLVKFINETPFHRPFSNWLQMKELGEGRTQQVDAVAIAGKKAVRPI